MRAYALVEIGDTQARDRIAQLQSGESMWVSEPARRLAKVLAAVAVGFATYVAYAHPYGGLLAYFVYGLYFGAALALLWIGDRLIRRFRKR